MVNCSAIQELRDYKSSTKDEERAPVNIIITVTGKKREKKKIRKAGKEAPPNRINGEGGRAATGRKGGSFFYLGPR